MGLQQLQLFYMLTVAEEKSFSKAAEKLFISQPALSHCILRLEKQMGVKLFDRSTNPLSLTYAGVVFAQEAKQILELQHKLQTNMQDIADFKKGRLTIGISVFQSSLIFPLVLPKFHEKFPDIDIIPVEGNYTQLTDLAIRGITDLTFAATPLNIPRFKWEPLFSENVILMAPRSHYISKNASQFPPWTKIHLADLRKEPFILLHQGRRLRQIADQCFVNAGFQPRIIFESHIPETLYNLVGAGMGLSFGTDAFVRFASSNDKVTYFTLDEHLPSRTLSIIYLEGKYLPRAALEFITLTKEIFSKLSSCQPLSDVE